MTGCLDEATVLAFLGGALEPDARGSVETHVAACSACAEILTWAAADSANASRAPGREGAPFLGQLAPGARVDRYQILAPIGRGGMGEVYAAYHPDLDRRIALKIVFESGADAAERRTRLLREARAIARLSHPNVVTVFDAGTVGERVYIAMEFVDGETLDAWLAAKPRRWAEILDVFVAAGRGLAAAHAAKIIHRDFKPQNVMIARDESVRVMDFGLAQLVSDEARSNPGKASEEADARPDDSASDEAATSRTAPTVTRATKTGALLGTPAYMAPEQWGGGSIDARSDEYSFCVALFEALYGTRPVMGHLDSQRDAGTEDTGAPRLRPRVAIPRWLRDIVTRGLSPTPEARFPSMTELLASVARARSRPRRQASGLALALVVALTTFGWWRLSQAHRFDCAPPRDRIAAAWPAADGANEKRERIHAAILSSGGAQGQTIWQRLSSTIDPYLDQWRGMYKEACEATHVRGEQSSEVLDLRMRCLNENLDEVHALTDVLVSGRQDVAAGALGAASNLTPVARCADVRLLRSAVPLPRDERTLRRVEELQRSLKAARTLYDFGRFREALASANAVRRDVESTGYNPLLAQLLNLVGEIQVDIAHPAEGKETLQEAIVAAEAGSDDVQVAAAASDLAVIVGYREGRTAEGKLWTKLAYAALDRAGPGHDRIRAWIMQSEGIIQVIEHNNEQALQLFRGAIALKERTLGEGHPDVAVSYAAVAVVLNGMGRPREALDAVDRALRIDAAQGGRVANTWNTKAEILRALRREKESREAFERALSVDQADWMRAGNLTGLGRAMVSDGDPQGAIPLLEKALKAREAEEPDPSLVAETRFVLAGALWNSGDDRARALSLATAARGAYESQHQTRELTEVDAWLATHKPRHGRR